MTGPFDSAATGAPSPAPQDRALPCPECCGEGFIEVIGGPGYFDEARECWMPSEDVEPCGACRGTGVIEPVAACSESVTAPEPTPDRPRPQDRGKEDDPWTTTSWTR